MKKFDWFTMLIAITIVENTICFIIQGGWLAVGGLLFGGFWAWVAYWDWKYTQQMKRAINEVADVCQQSIGDVTCSYNARSPHLRCAINPDGLCHECQHYEKL